MDKDKDEAKAIGGRARADSLSEKERREIAKKAAEARWAKVREQEAAGEVVVTDGPPLPVAKYRGFLNLLDWDVPCFVLDNGKKVIGRTSFTETLTGIKGGGGLEKYLEVKNLNPFINMDLVLEGMVAFRLPEVDGLEKQVKGLPSDLAIDIWRGFVAALEATMKPGSPHTLTSRQTEMALKASMLLAACAKVGLEALIDEATGYQYDRAEDALQVKLRAYLSDEMRKWEKTFPDDLWVMFGKLTGWNHSVTKRPKYWGKLVNELVYQYLDPDVFQWLKVNVPAPKHGQNYHQWLTAQYGLKKLVEHIWKLIGVGGTCRNMSELKRKMAEMHGKIPIQLTLWMDP